MTKMDQFWLFLFGLFLMWISRGDGSFDWYDGQSFFFDPIRSGCKLWNYKITVDRFGERYETIFKGRVGSDPEVGVYEFQLYNNKGWAGYLGTCMVICAYNYWISNY
jgi:hypothetical protein